MASDCDSSSSSTSESDSELADNWLPWRMWFSGCRRLRSLFRHGHGHFHLGRAYTAGGVHGMPAIMIPGSTRMVVSAGKVLAQSFAQCVARYKATCSAHQHLQEGPAPTRTHNKSVAVVNSIGERLADVKTIMPPLFTYACLCLPGGFLGGALEVQATQSVSSPFHTSSYRT